MLENKVWKLKKNLMFEEGWGHNIMTRWGMLEKQRGVNVWQCMKWVWVAVRVLGSSHRGSALCVRTSRDSHSLTNVPTRTLNTEENGRWRRAAPGQRDLPSAPCSDAAACSLRASDSALNDHRRAGRYRRRLNRTHGFPHLLVAFRTRLRSHFDFLCFIRRHSPCPRAAPRLRVSRWLLDRRGFAQSLGRPRGGHTGLAKRQHGARSTRTVRYSRSTATLCACAATVPLLACCIQVQ